MREFMSKSRIPKSSVLLLLTSILPLVPFILHYLDDHHDSSLPFKLFTYSSERNYMFLFCNGILVLIFANSSAERNSELGSDPIVEQIKKTDNFERIGIAVKFELEKTGDDDYYIDKYPIVEEEEEEETEEVDDGDALLNEEEEEEEETEEVDDGNALLNEEEEEEEEQKEEEETEEVDDGNALLNEEEEQKEEEETEEVDDGNALLNEEEVDSNKQNGKCEIELLSVDELNRKFEDFIRKMRKQIDNGGT